MNSKKWIRNKLYLLYYSRLWVPDPKEIIPGTSADCHAIIGYTQTADLVIMSCQVSHLFSADRIPDDGIFALPGEQQSTRLAKVHGSDAIIDMVLIIFSHQLIASNIEETTFGIS